MKKCLIYSAAITLALFTQQIIAGSIADTYTTGDTLTATMLDNIKNSVNDNDTRTSTNETDIANLENTVNSIDGIFNSSITYRIPVLSTTSANTLVSIWLANISSIDCNIYIDERNSTWQIGANAKTNLILIPSYSTLFMPRRFSSGTFPNITTTTTIVAHTNLNANISTSDFVDVSLYRSETNTSDTCGVDAIQVKGAIVTYPGGSRYFVPAKEMVIH